MSLQDIRSECTDFATLLQPFVDQELGQDEHQRVSDHLTSCRACRSAVSEQMWVRSTLRSLPVPTAPVSMRRKIAVCLDEVDAQRAEASQLAVWRRLREASRTFMRGGMVMVPAAAVAVGLFVVVSGNLTTSSSPPSLSTSLATASTPPPAMHIAAAPSWSKQLATLEPERAASGRTSPRSHRVQLVSARLDEGTEPEGGAHLMFRVVQDGQAEGAHVIDRQRPAGGPPPRGTPVTFRGQRYLMGRADDGNPFLHFEHGGIAHWVRLEPGPSASLPPRATPVADDLALLLDVADHLSGTRE